MKGNRDGYRERWIDAVLWTNELSPTTKVVCLAMSRHMDDRGRIKRKHADIAKDLQMANPKRVGDRIKEARDAFFLSQVPGTGINARVTQYDAMIPPAERAHAPQSKRVKVPPVDVLVPGNRGPETGDQDVRDLVTSGPRKQGTNTRARYSQNRSTGPAPDGSRGPDDHDETSQAAVGASWLPTPPKRSSSDSTGRVA
ncbi:hypothetical protein ACI8AA_06880 [Geodermatophilus sp. SYSU D01180]